jgi:hypothetical protein
MFQWHKSKQNAPQRTNDMATCTSIKTKSVQLRSGDVPMADPQRSEWYAVRKRHGADSRIGRQCSKLVQLSLALDDLSAHGEYRERLVASIAREKARLAELLAAADPSQ